MPRIQVNNNSGDFVKKPVGVLECKIMEAVWVPLNNLSTLPNLSYIQDKDNIGVLDIQVMPEGHDRTQRIFIPVKVQYNDSSEIDINKSSGIKTIHMVLNELGTKNAGFTPAGDFVNEEDEMIQFEEIGSELMKHILQNPDYRVLAHIYKRAGADGKHYFTSGRFIYSTTNRKFAEEQAVKELAYEQSRAERLATTTENEPPAPITPVEGKPARAFAKKL